MEYSSANLRCSWTTATTNCRPSAHRVCALKITVLSPTVMKIRALQSTYIPWTHHTTLLPLQYTHFRALYMQQVPHTTCNLYPYDLTISSSSIHSMLHTYMYMQVCSTGMAKQKHNFMALIKRFEGVRIRQFSPFFDMCDSVGHLLRHLNIKNWQFLYE